MKYIAESGIVRNDFSTGEGIRMKPWIVLFGFALVLQMVSVDQGYALQTLDAGKLALARPKNLETCFSPDESCDQRLMALIRSAETSVDVAIYSVTHQGIVDAIVEVQKRGVKVRMVVDRSQSKGTRSLVGDLQDAGVPLKIGTCSGIMHNKFTIVDGEIIETGSFNYTDGATGANAENQLYLTDANPIPRYQANFDRLWARGKGE